MQNEIQKEWEIKEIVKKSFEMFPNDSMLLQVSPGEYAVMIETAMEERNGASPEPIKYLKTPKKGGCHVWIERNNSFERCQMQKVLSGEGSEVKENP